ncbi:MAG: fimbrillin family protein, partial [Proteiniphilum sp.]|nr:fimbrillin family protein [Proteiniphilum sp.]
MKAIQSQNIHWLRRHTITVWVALATITLAGCSGEEVSVIERPAETAAVLFDARMISEIQSRATTMDLTTLKEEAFGVLAYYTNGYNWSNASPPNFMYNQKVNWNSTKWEYSPVKYWPIVPDDKVSFFAYAPYDDQMPATLTDNHGITLSGNTLPGAPYIDFNVNTDVIADQVDLV